MVGEDDSPRYRIRAVAERTGISTATLRAWERRYRLPEPTRSDGRYRLYSERELCRVRRMAALCEGGLRPAEAARIVRAQTVPRMDDALAVGAVDEEKADRIIESFRAIAINALRAALEIANEHAEPHVARELLATIARLTTSSPGTRRKKPTRRRRRA